MAYLVRIDTAANFTADNPVLLPNQIGQESDTYLTKRGDGATAWNSLDYDTPTIEAFEQVLSGLTYKVPSSYAVQQAITAGATDNLSTVLGVGNDATNQSIINLNQITKTTGTSNIVVDFNDLAGNSWYAWAYETVSGREALVQVSAVDNSVLLYSYNGTNASQLINYVDNGLITSDKATYKGYLYGADYSANYTARSLIDKGYAAATFAPIGSGVTSVNAATGAVTLTHTTAQGVSGIWTGTALALTLGALTGVTSLNGLVVTANTGVITTGTWNATLIGTQYGGTGANNSGATVGAVPYYSSSTVQTFLAATATAGQMLRSGASAAPTWSTATYPATATGTGTILRADGTNWVATTATYPTTTTANQILFSTAANVIGGSTTLLTNGAYLVVGNTALYASEVASFTKNQNASTDFYIVNSTSGTAGRVVFAVSNTVTLASITQYSAGYTPTGASLASGSLFAGSGSGGLGLAATNAAGNIYFYSGGTTEMMRISTVGNVSIGGTAVRGTTVGTNAFQIFDGTAPVGTLANGCSFYSAAGLPSVMNAAGTGWALPYYAQGTFTPVVTLTGAGTAPQYTTASGTYSRIGRLCFFNILLTGDGGNEGAGAGTITITLPFSTSADQLAIITQGGTSANGATENILYMSLTASSSTFTVKRQQTATQLTDFTGADQSNTTRSMQLMGKILI